VGVWRSLLDLKRQGDRIGDAWDPAAQLAQAQAQMDATADLLDAQTAAAQVATSGEPATATIVAVRQGRAMINLQPTIEIDLTVLRPSRPPYAATVKQVMPLTQLASAQPGRTVAVRVHPDDPASIWIDWAS
jgi:hypothetical protein